jgi:tripartite-type tricarboxylate transporter receptor subunit TctC
MLNLRPLVLIASLVSALYAATAFGQAWPARSVRFLVPFPPGGSTDVAARALSDKLSAALGQQVLVENKGGGGGAVGTGEAARAAPDGYTILFAANAVTLLHLAVKDLPYDTLRDFLPITQVTTQPNALAVQAALPVKTVPDLVAYAKANPGKLSYAHPGAGSAQHLVGELLKKLAGVDMLGVPYRGGGQAIQDLLGGQVQVAVLGSTPLMPQHKAGRVRILAFTGLERFSAMPDIPTLAESGFAGIDSTQWLELLAPRGTPNEVVQRVHAETVKALALAEVRERLAQAALQPVGNTPEQFGRLIRSEIERWTRVAQELGIKPQ